MTQQNRQPGQGQTGESSQPSSQPSSQSGQTGGAHDRQSGKGSGAGANHQPGNATAGGEETPEQWLEENSLGDPDETGNTITGENEY